MILYHNNANDSGLGSRLLDLCQLLALSRLLNKKLYSDWAKWMPNKLTAKHRNQDILWENVKNYIIFPEDLIINEKPKEEFECFSSYLGGTIFFIKGENDPKGLESFYELFIKSRNLCSYEEFKNKTIEAAKSIKFSETINSFLSTLPKDIISLHVRRTDKVRTENDDTDDTMIFKKELEDLNMKTKKWIKYYINHSNNNFYVCGDDLSANNEFIDFINQNGGKVYKPPLLEKWQETYYDLAVLSYSKEIILSQVTSNFAILASWIGNENIKTIFSLEKTNENK